MPAKGFPAIHGSPEYALAQRACETNNSAFLNMAISQTADDDLEFIYGITRRDAGTCVGLANTSELPTNLSIHRNQEGPVLIGLLPLLSRPKAKQRSGT
jgi:hypothetical protein